MLVDLFSLSHLLSGGMLPTSDSFLFVQVSRSPSERHATPPEYERYFCFFHYAFCALKPPAKSLPPIPKDTRHLSSMCHRDFPDRRMCDGESFGYSCPDTAWEY